VYGARWNLVPGFWDNWYDAFSDDSSSSSSSSSSYQPHWDSSSSSSDSSSWSSSSEDPSSSSSLPRRRLLAADADVDYRPVGDSPDEMGDSLPFVDLETDASAQSISCGDYFCCAVLDGGGVKCWGECGKALTFLRVTSVCPRSGARQQ
jgi:hypothetical protein